MKKIYKTKLLIIVALAAALMLLSAGCGSNKEGSADGGTEGQSGAAKQSFNESGFPIVSEKITMSAFAPQSANIADLNTNWFTKYLEEKTNIHLEWQLVPQDGLQEKKQLLLASGDYPDIFMQGNLTKEEQLLYGQQGVFIPLNDLIDKYAPNIKKAFEDISYLEKAITAPDGNIYAIPSVNECYHCQFGSKMWVNSKWLEKLGLSAPKTTDEFYGMLKAFKEQDPNGNGKADEIALTGSPTGWFTDVETFIMNAFVYYNKENNYFMMNNGVLETAADKPGFKKGLEFLHKLYAEGLIDKEAFTQKSDALAQKGNHPDLAIVGAVPAGWFGEFTDASPEATRHKEYDPIAPLTGPDGVSYAAHYVGIGNSVFAITNVNKKPEAAIRLADYLYSEEGTIMSNFGEEGRNWKKAESGDKNVNGTQSVFKVLETSYGVGQVQNDHWNQMGPGLRSKAFRENAYTSAQDPYTMDGLELRLHLATKNLYEGHQPKEEFPTDIFLSPEQADRVKQLKPIVTDYIKQSMLEFIMGNKDLDKDWDAYVKGLKDSGMDEFIRIYQEAYDNVYK
ncbi:ABC transporter substrate-binding protein [Paenibacillus thermotolerans]|uniref:ABC transporter substrate-binding protein n=1 Tax=Paenibacillus thermotolerans TaxID=3027807 RepID=UPI002367AF45|nr:MULTISPECIES: ABC transporter substrate-binding protein [unclassified Paenibacillus]